MRRNSFVIFLACASLLVIGKQLDAQTENRTKEFIVMGYEGVIADLPSGDGPYLKTLRELLKATPDQWPKMIEQIRSFSKTYP